MPTYVYETIPQIPGVEPRRFELRQSMSEAALTVDSETGEPVRRVISGGYGFVAQRAAPAASPTPAACRPGCGCHVNR